MLAVRANELAELVGQIEVPDRAFRPDWPSDRTISAQIDEASATWDDSEAPGAGKRNHDSARTRSWRPRGC